jgi:hypothetical protein
MEMLMEHHDTAKSVVDVISVATVVGTLVQLLPAVAALLTIAWTAIRIWETKTVQGWFGRKPKSAGAKNEAQN